MQKLLSILLFCLFLMSSAIAQTDTQLNQLIERLGNYEEQFPKEKVYLHLDRSYYSPGDDVWFKAYVTIGSFNLLSQHSQLINVELINSENEVLQGIRLPLSAGISVGDFALDSTLTNGSYRIRAYTQWMRNFDEAYFYDKTIQVVDPLQNGEQVESIEESKGTRREKTKKGAFSLQEQKFSSDKDSMQISLHPEGGHLSIGVPNKVVVQVKSIADLPLATKGWLLGTNEERLQEIESSQNGLGEFIFIPEENINYTVFLQDDKGHSQAFPLPTPENGYSLAIHRFTDSLLRIQIRMDPKGEENQKLRLVVQQNGQVFYASQLHTKKMDALLNIPTDVLGDGVNEITLFNANMEAVAYRTVFYSSPTRRLPLKIETNKSSYSTREKVKVNIQSGFESDTFRVAAFSAAVTHVEKVPYDAKKEDNILSYLLLKSSINEAMEVPLTEVLKDKSKQNKLDDFMLTLDRSEVWKKLNRKEIEYPVEKSMQVSGWVTKLNEKKPVPFAKVVLLSSEHGLFLDTLADENGRFKFDRLFFSDDAKFILQARGEKGQKHLLIHLDSLQKHKSEQKKNSLEISSRTKEEEEQYKENNKDRLQEMMRTGTMEKGIVLSDVQVTKEKKSHSTNLNGPGNADQVIEAKDLETCPSLEICLQGRLVGVIFQNGVPYSTRSMDIPMGLIVDGMQMEGSEISMISSFDVETIEVLRNAHYLTMYGSFGAGGIIIITTKRGDGGRSASDYTPGLVTYSPKGFSPSRDFVSPDYSSDKQKYIQNDLRSTIYWKPNLVSDEDGNTSFDFFTSDQAGKYRIIVQGIDMYGKLGYSLMEFEVVN